MSGHTAHRLAVSVLRSGIREEIDTGLWDACPAEKTLAGPRSPGEHIKRTLVCMVLTEA